MSIGESGGGRDKERKWGAERINRGDREAEVGTRTKVSPRDNGAKKGRERRPEVAKGGIDGE